MTMSIRQDPDGFWYHPDHTLARRWRLVTLTKRAAVVEYSCFCGRSEHKHRVTLSRRLGGDLTRSRTVPLSSIAYSILSELIARQERGEARRAHT